MTGYFSTTVDQSINDLIEETLNMSEEEIFAEVAASEGDPEIIATRIRARVQRALEATEPSQPSEKTSAEVINPQSRLAARVRLGSKWHFSSRQWLTAATAAVLLLAVGLGNIYVKGGWSGRSTNEIETTPVGASQQRIASGEGYSTDNSAQAIADNHATEARDDVRKADNDVKKLGAKESVVVDQTALKDSQPSIVQGPQTAPLVNVPLPIERPKLRADIANNMGSSSSPVPAPSQVRPPAIARLKGKFKIAANGNDASPASLPADDALSHNNGFNFSPASQYDGNQYSDFKLPGYDNEDSEATIFTIIARGASPGHGSDYVIDQFWNGMGATWPGAGNISLTDKVTFSDGAGHDVTPTNDDPFPIAAGKADFASLLKNGPVMIGGPSGQTPAQWLLATGLTPDGKGIICDDTQTGGLVELSYDPVSETVGGITGVFDAKTKGFVALAEAGNDIPAGDLSGLAGLRSFVPSTYYAVTVH